MHLALTCLILSIYHVLAQKDPSIVRINKPQIITRGSNAKLTCMLENIGEHTVVWLLLRDNSIPITLTMGNKRNTADHRFQAYLNNDKSSYILDINDVRYEDTGIYMCQIATTLPTKSRKVWLRVPTPPNIGDDISKDVVINEGGSIQLKCNATGYPTPKISWKRADNNPLSNGLSEFEGNTLSISSVKKSDRGMYKCIASNDVDAGDTKLVMVNVEFAPILSGAKIRVGQAPNYQLNAVLECFVESFPAPDVWWTVGEDSGPDAKIMNNHNYRIDIIHDSSGHDLTTSRLTIIEVQSEDYGKYKCWASNVRGKSSLIFTLFESSVPLNHYGGYENSMVNYITSSAQRPIKSLFQFLTLFLFLSSIF